MTTVALLFIWESQGTTGRLGKNSFPVDTHKIKSKYLPLSPTPGMYAKLLSDFPEFFATCSTVLVLFFRLT